MSNERNPRDIRIIHKIVDFSKIHHLEMLQGRKKYSRSAGHLLKAQALALDEGVDPSTLTNAISVGEALALMETGKIRKY